MTETTQKTNHFKELYNRPIEQTRLLKEKILLECGISDKTFYNWLNGETEIPKLAKEKIAILMGVPLGELFPEERKEEENG